MTKGKKFVTLDNNLHVLGYSSKINKFLKYESLIKNIYFLKKNKFNPYRTSYYKRKWGFLYHFNKFKKLNKKSLQGSN